MLLQSILPFLPLNLKQIYFRCIVVETYCSDKPTCFCFPFFVLNELLLAIIYPSICHFL